MDTVVKEEIEELRESYIEEMRNTVRTMRQHATQLNSAARVKTSYPLLLYLAHQVKGTAGTLGFPRFSEVAKKLAAELEEFLDRDVPISRSELSEKAVERIGELEELVNEAG